MTNQHYRPIEYDEETRDVAYPPPQREQTINPSIAHHPQGRIAPPISEPHFEIKLDGQVIGTVYPKRLTAGALMDLEDGLKTRDHIQWLVTYAGGDAKQVEAVLRPLPLSEARTFIETLIDALTKALAMGNGSGPR